MIEIKDRIREALEIRSMTAAELSKKSGIGKGSISKYLAGFVVPKQSAIGAMARALMVSPAWLMGYDVPMAPQDTLPGGGFHGSEDLEKVKSRIFNGDIQKLTEPNQARLMAYYQALLDTQEKEEGES